MCPHYLHFVLELLYFSVNLLVHSLLLPFLQLVDTQVRSLLLPFLQLVDPQVRSLLLLVHSSLLPFFQLGQLIVNSLVQPYFNLVYLQAHLIHLCLEMLHLLIHLCLELGGLLVQLIVSLIIFSLHLLKELHDGIEVGLNHIQYMLLSIKSSTEFIQSYTIIPITEN